MKPNKIVALFLCITLIFSQNLFAARLGGGKSYGMKRSMPSNSGYNAQRQQPSYTPPQQVGGSNTAGTQQARPGMGAGTAAMLGAAGGAVGGYMLGKSMSNNQGGSSAPIQTAIAPQGDSSNSIPWGTIAILAVLLFIGLMLFRRNRATNPGFSGTNNPVNSNQNSFKIPTINRTNTAQTQQSFQTNGAPQTTVNTMDKMPDGIETIYFIRQVKGMFLHIQSINNLDNVHEIEKYMTATLYDEIKSSISNNNFVADFSSLDCQLLDCELNGNQLIASVKFFGMVSEEPNQPSKPFSEIWNFVKSDLTNNKWLVAGIQQETLN